MTALDVHGSVIPQSQNTASVHEFRCLYTHDIRRKQKRWQDGFVKFHTFNKRVMVYDEGRNFLGDTHWKEQGKIQTDDEVTLDIGILVQVGDILATSQTNLAPLFERERKMPEEGPRLSMVAHVTLGGKMNNRPRGGLQKHRSLNALLGTPKGAYGRSALPTKSPYEIRNTGDEKEWEDSLDVKRRKVDQPWTVKQVRKEVPLWARTSDACNSSKPMTKSKLPSTRQQGLIMKEIVDITSDNEGAPTSDVTFPSTSPRAPFFRPATMAKITAKTPALRIPKPKITPRREVLSSPPVSARNHLKNIDMESIVDNERPPEIKPILAPLKTKPAINAKPLRIAKSQPRSMLFCQKANTRPAPEPPKQSERKQPSARDVSLSDREDEVIIVTKPLLKRQWRPNAYESLSDLDDDVPLSKVVPEKPQHATTNKGISKPHPSGIQNGRPAVLVSDGTTRSSSPAFRTIPPRLEHIELPLNSDVGTSCPSPTAEWRQPVKPHSLESAGMKLLHGLMDRQVLTTSNAQVPASEPAHPPFPPQTTTIGVRPFRRVQSESNADSLPVVEEVVDEAESIKPGSPRKPKASAKRLLRRPLKRAMSLATGSTQKSKSTSHRQQAEKAPKKEEQQESGPWTVEATDLFDWRPPDWEDRMKQRAKETTGK